MDEYKIEYLQTFKDDLNDIVRYIALKIDNRPASHKLVDDIQKKIEMLKTTLEIYQYYDFIKPLKIKCRYFVVGNYITFYNVDKVLRVVTIYRILYNKRNIDSAMK